MMIKKQSYYYALIVTTRQGLGRENKERNINKSKILHRFAHYSV